MIQEKTIGILGGMGPYATLTFFKKLIDMTPAKKDWEHKTIIHTMPSIKKIGLLATEATSRGPLYRESLKREGIDVIAPPPNSHEEKRVRRIIEDVKLNKINKTTKKEIISLCNWLKAKGAEAVILGCTEIPAAISPSELNIPAFDSIHIYAQATVQKAREGSN